VSEWEGCYGRRNHFLDQWIEWKRHRWRFGDHDWTILDDFLYFGRHKYGQRQYTGDIYRDLHRHAVGRPGPDANLPANPRMSGAGTDYDSRWQEKHPESSRCGATENIREWAASADGYQTEVPNQKDCCSPKSRWYKGNEIALCSE
jgi:hypothetical protein